MPRRRDAAAPGARPAARETWAVVLAAGEGQAHAVGAAQDPAPPGRPAPGALSGRARAGRRGRGERGRRGARGGGRAHGARRSRAALRRAARAARHGGRPSPGAAGDAGSRHRAPAAVRRRAARSRAATLAALLARHRAEPRRRDRPDVRAAPIRPGTGASAAAGTAACGPSSRSGTRRRPSAAAASATRASTASIPRRLWPALEAVARPAPTNAQGEVYLTDVIGELARRGSRVEAVRVADPLEVAGVNDRRQLAVLEGRLRVADARRAHDRRRDASSIRRRRTSTRPSRWAAIPCSIRASASRGARRSGRGA